MSDLAPDEKICPFCAETIKKAAVRCRYCQSDLPPDEVPAVQEPPPAPPPPAPPDEDPDEDPDDDTSDDPGETGPQPFLASLRLMVVLLVLCLVLAVVTVFAYERSQNPAAGKGPITSTSARETALTQASTLTQRVLSYSYKTLDSDIKASEAVLAPSFRSEYAKTMAGVHAQTVKNQVVLSAAVSAVSVVSASEEKVVALVFVDQTTTATGTNNRRLDQNRVLVTLTRDGGEWRVSKMDAF
jgi:hypothetical protein